MSFNINAIYRLCCVCYSVGEMADSTVGYCSTVHLCVNSSALAGWTHGV